ncbi:hypothetical protein V6L77_17190 [Pannonibacter sp. Pt2-lr]
MPVIAPVHGRMAAGGALLCKSFNVLTIASVPKKINAGADWKFRGINSFSRLTGQTQGQILMGYPLLRSRPCKGAEGWSCVAYVWPGLSLRQAYPTAPALQAPSRAGCRPLAFIGLTASTGQQDISALMSAGGKPSWMQALETVDFSSQLPPR